MSAFCTNCGGAFTEGDRWCGDCGTARFQGEVPEGFRQAQSISTVATPSWMNALPLPLAQIELFSGIAAAAGIVIIFLQYVIGYVISDGEITDRFFWKWALAMLVAALGSITPVGIGLFQRVTKSQDSRGDVLLRVGALAISLKGIDYVSQILDNAWPDALWRKGVFLIATLACLLGSVPGILAILPKLKSLPNIFKNFNKKFQAIAISSIVLLVLSHIFSRSLSLTHGGIMGDVYGHTWVRVLVLPFSIFVLTALLMTILSDEQSRVLGAGSLLVLHVSTFGAMIVQWGLAESYLRSFFQPSVGSVIYDIAFGAVLIALMPPIGSAFSNPVRQQIQ